MLKFKEGDRVRVVNDVTRHGLNIGQVVKIITCNDILGEYLVQNGDNFLYLEPTELGYDETHSDLNENKPLSSRDLIIKECDELKELLLKKNAMYGDSALKSGILFNIDPVTAIQARINDKLSRIANKGLNEDTEDSIQDLLGYFILLRISKITKCN